MDEARLRELAYGAYHDELQAKPQQPDEEDCWRAEMQAAGVPEELREVMCDLLKELHGALGADGWSHPKDQTHFLIKRLDHYQSRLWQSLAEQLEHYLKMPREVVIDDQVTHQSLKERVVEIASKNASEGKF